MPMNIAAQTQSYTLWTASYIRKYKSAWNDIRELVVRQESEEKPKPTPVRKPEMSYEQALQYGLMCNAYLEHEDDMEQYK